MATPVAAVVKVNWKLVLPWLALFRALGLALHVRQVFVGITAVLLIAISEQLIGGMPMSRETPVMKFDASLVSWVWLPWVDLVYPFAPSRLINHSGIAFPGRDGEWWHLLASLLRFACVLVVGSLAGGVLVRRAGMEFAREESTGLLATVRFVLKRSLDYLSAPALPLVVVGALGGLLWTAGLLARLIPGADYLLSAAWGLVVITGIVMTILSFAVFFGWPMMIAAVSLNGGDGFDALSRGFGFVLDRWRYYAWCVVVMTAYGALSLLLMVTAIRYGEYLAMTSLAWGANHWSVQNLPQVLPDGFWQSAITVVIRGFAYSLFWSSMAIIYLVLRQSVDNTELNEIYVEGSPQDSDGLQGLVNPTLPEPPPPPTLLPIINQP